jgi:hypothetical protein
VRYRRFRQPDAPGAAAETIARFKQQDGKIRADCLQATSSGNAGGASADDDDILLGAPAVVTRHAFSSRRSPLS